MVLGLGDADGIGGAVAIVAALLAVVAIFWSVVAPTGPIASALGSLWSGITGAVGSLLGVTGTDAILFGGGAVGIAVAIWRASEAPSGEESTLWPLVALVSLASMGYVVLSDLSGFAATAMSLWWLPILLVVAYVGFVFVDERTMSGSGSSATTQTNRRVGNTAEEVANAGFGIVVAILGTAGAVAMAAMGALEVFGDLLAQFAGEASFLVVTALGYLGLGGSLPLDWIVPELSPAQFVAIAMIIGGLAIAFRR